MTPDLKKFEEKRKESLFETIGSTIWIWLEDLLHTMGFGKKPVEKVTKKVRANQITLELDKYENARINKSK